MKLTFTYLQDAPKLKDWLEGLEKTKIPRQGGSKVIMNYLVTEGFKDAAEKFSKESGLPLSGIDISASLEQRIKIRDAIHEGKIMVAKELVDQLYPQMLQNDPMLLFKMQQQHLIELIREKRVEEVLSFAQKELANRVEGNSDVLTELERTLALLAFDNPANSPFGDLLHVSHRQKVASDVNAAILEQDGAESTVSSLVVALHMLLWAQEELDKKKVKYPKMTDIAAAAIMPPK